MGGVVVCEVLCGRGSLYVRYCVGGVACIETWAIFHCVKLLSQLLLVSSSLSEHFT